MNKEVKPLEDYNFFDPQVIECPYSFYKLAREQAPVMELPAPMPDVKLFLVTRYDLVMQILHNVEVFSSNFSTLLAGKEAQDAKLQEIYAQGWPQVNTLLTADPPEHERFRALVNKAFTASRVNKIQDDIEQVVDELIDGFIDQGECEFISSFASPLPIKVIATQLGVPQEDMPKFKKWSDSFIIRMSQMNSQEQEIECAKDVVAFQHYFHNRIEERRKQPQDDVISDLVQAKIAGERALNMAELLNILQQLLVAGNETITNALAGGMLLLIQNPEQMQAVQAEPAKVDNLVEEILRMESPTAGMWRVVQQDTQLEGVSIPAGSLVMVRFDSANRDPMKFPDGENFSLCRQNASSHLAFGHGIHFCVGAMLARKEMQIAYKRLLRRLQHIRLAPGKNDLKHQPNIVLRGLKQLYIEFNGDSQ
ncbi:MAG: cytochrome P450 [Coleofasciculus sp. G1-WW12-02]|uniref:cytochrome P450 n=1 Tax=Coleofasciculus sp. G1-WW12-02 TaxID=3068483 RepID=UPI0032F125C2